jgi:hypothetical protein
MTPKGADELVEQLVSENGIRPGLWIGQRQRPSLQFRLGGDDIGRAQQEIHYAWRDPALSNELEPKHRALNDVERWSDFSKPVQDWLDFLRWRILRQAVSTDGRQDRLRRLRLILVSIDAGGDALDLFGI